MPKVSVIIPTYNNAQYVGEAIESVLTQTFQDFEILVINDGSTDCTAEVALSYKDQIRYFEQKNRGPASARNTGIKHALGKYLAFLDADDFILPKKLEQQVQYLEAHPEIDLVYSDGLRLKIDRTGRETDQKFSETGEIVQNISSSEEFVYQLMLRNLCPIHASLVKRSCVIDLGGFDETLLSAEDWDLWFRHSEKYTIAYLGELTAIYRIRDGSISSNPTRIYMGTEKFLNKITHSPKFVIAPKKIHQAFFFNYGISALSIGDGKNAKKRFLCSYAYGGKNLKVIASIILTTLFSSNAFLFFKIKRKFFGMHGMHVDFG